MKKTLKITKSGETVTVDDRTYKRDQIGFIIDEDHEQAVMTAFSQPFSFFELLVEDEFHNWPTYTINHETCRVNG